MFYDSFCSFTYHYQNYNPNLFPYHIRRFGLRPSYPSNNDGEYGRPGGSNSNRPTAGRPNYGYGYGGYGDNGAYGSHGFEVNQRPGSIHFSGNGGRPHGGGGYGIYGTVGEQDEFPATEGVGAPAPPSNIHTQKVCKIDAIRDLLLFFFFFFI